MAFVVRTYLSSGFDHVILSSIVLSDQEITDRILRLVREQGSAALVATHNERLAARMDRLVRLHEGRLV